MRYSSPTVFELNASKSQSADSIVAANVAVATAGAYVPVLPPTVTSAQVVKPTIARHKLLPCPYPRYDLLVQRSRRVSRRHHTINQRGSSAPYSKKLKSKSKTRMFWNKESDQVLRLAYELEKSVPGEIDWYAIAERVYPMIRYQLDSDAPDTYYELCHANKDSLRRACRLRYISYLSGNFCQEMNDADHELLRQYLKKYSQLAEFKGKFSNKTISDWWKQDHPERYFSPAKISNFLRTKKGTAFKHSILSSTGAIDSCNNQVVRTAAVRFFPPSPERAEVQPVRADYAVESGSSEAPQQAEPCLSDILLDEEFLKSLT